MAFRVQARQAAEPKGSNEYRVDIEDDDSPWILSLSFVRDPRAPGKGNGDWVCIGCSVHAPPGAADDQRRVPGAEVTAAALDRLAARWPQYLALARPTLDFDMQDAAKRTTALRAQGQGRRGLSDEFYEWIAEEYRRLIERGARPTTELAEAHGVARSTASNWIARARELGHLGPATPGRAGEGGKQ